MFWLIIFSKDGIIQTDLVNFETKKKNLKIYGRIIGF